MKQVKLFKTVENEIWSLEKEINDWIYESGATIVSVTGNIAPQTRGSADSFSASDVLVVVLFEPKA